MQNLIDAVKSSFRKTTEHLKDEFSRIQTGQANASLIENVQVEAYGTRQPLKAVAGISVQDGRTLIVQPWDRSVLGDIEKGLQKADLGTNPVNDGVVIRVILPPMTEERRRKLVKIVHDLAEEARISIRQQRQEHHKNAKKDESRTEDQHRDFERQLQEAVDKANTEIEELTKRKETDVMKV